MGGSGFVRQSTELAIGVVFRMLSAFLGSDWRPRRVCFAHDPPADRSVHKGVFGHHVEFGHDFNGIVCARADLEVPDPDADPEVARLARADAGGEFRAQGTGHDHQCARAGGDAARDRNVHDRSGRAAYGHRPAHDSPPPRKVKERPFPVWSTRCGESSPSASIKDSHRSLAEVASLLGFSAPSGFSRWYRQRFKAKPSERRTRIASR